MEYERQYLTIQADENTISKESLDCGIKSLNWCTGSKCQNLATITNFIITLSAIGFLQGAVQSYFRISIQQAAVNLNFDPVILDWLIVYSGIIQASAALLLLRFAGKFHQMSCLGGFIILQAAFSFLAIIPTLDQLSIEKNLQNNTTIDTNLCLLKQIEMNETILEPIHSTTTLVLLFILQIPIEFGFIAFYTIGITYVDDNTKPTNSAIFFGIIFCSYIWGSQLGIGLSYLLSVTPVEWWLGWAVLIPLLLLVGIIILLFPRKLIQTLVEQAAKKILERNYHINLQQNFIEDFGFLPTMTRLFTNKILIVNLLALVFVDSANINYYLHEQNYLQSRFFLPTSEANGLMDEWTSRFLTYLLRPPIIGISILISGFIISRLQPKGRSLAIWNAIIGVLLCLIFISYIFIDCSTVKIAETYRGQIIQPFCSKECICDANVEFTPVCEAKGKQTYFSPCHAGCSNVLNINNFALYQNCTCGPYTDQPVFNGMATAGACNINNCQIKWIIYQAITIIASALWYTTKVGRVIITIRSVLPQDKFYALGLELFLLGLITYIPVKYCYDAILVNTCQYWSNNRRKCLLQDSQIYGNYINILSAILILISLIFDILLILFTRYLDCFKKNNNEIDFSVPLQNMTSSAANQEDENEIERENTDRSNLLNIRDLPVLTEGSPGYGRLRHINQMKQNEDNNNIISAEANVVQPTKENNENVIENDDKLDFRLQRPKEENDSEINEIQAISSENTTKQQQPKETDF